ncbi:MAG: hypothetical protein DSY80_08220, partial [Desulfocapsa sp.]
MSSDRIYSILTAFPALMLIIGLVIYYKGESAQASGELILEQSQQIEGRVKGFSGLTPNSSKYYFWVTTPQRDRGLRILPKQLDKLDKVLQKGQKVTVIAAPRIDQSRVLWVDQII